MVLYAGLEQRRTRSIAREAANQDPLFFFKLKPSVNYPMQLFCCDTHIGKRGSAKLFVVN